LIEKGAYPLDHKETSIPGPRGLGDDQRTTKRRRWGLNDSTPGKERNKVVKMPVISEISNCVKKGNVKKRSQTGGPNILRIEGLGGLIERVESW